jgi:hypothetical protein
MEQRNRTYLALLKARQTACIMGGIIYFHGLLTFICFKFLSSASHPIPTSQEAKLLPLVQKPMHATRIVCLSFVPVRCKNIKISLHRVCLTKSTLNLFNHRLALTQRDNETK